MLLKSVLCLTAKVKSNVNLQRLKHIVYWASVHDYVSAYQRGRCSEVELAWWPLVFVVGSPALPSVSKSSCLGGGVCCVEVVCL